MPGESRTPIIFLARANSFQDRRRLRHLSKEQKKIAHILAKAHEPGLEVIETSSSTEMNFSDLLQNHAFNPDVNILHIAGYAAGDTLSFKTSHGEEKIDLKTFGRLISQLPNLKLVSLNGCATPALLEMLLFKDIPAIMVTEVLSGKRYSYEIAEIFYKMLIEGHSIKEAYEAVREPYWHFFSCINVWYDIESDQMEWKGKKTDSDHVEWGLYVHEGNDDKLNWRLPQELNGVKYPPVLDPGKEASPVEKPHFFSPLMEKAKWIGSGLVASFLVVLLLVLFQIPQKLQSFRSYSDVCLFNGDETYNIIQLPFYSGQDCDATDSSYTEAAWRRISLLSEEGSNTQSRIIKGLSCPVRFDVAERMILSCNANLVLWGVYEDMEGEAANLTFHYLYTGKPNMITHGTMPLEMEMALLDIDKDFEPSPIEDIVYWCQGMSHYEQGEYQEALNAFSKMREKEDKSYLAVDGKMAQCYLKLRNLEAAKFHYDHILTIDPENYTAYNERGNIFVLMRKLDEALLDFNDATRIRSDYADAYYNRALLFLRREEYSDAIDDIQKVMELRPEGGDPYGVLAAIYAELKEKDMFYSNFELALKKGFEVNKFVFYYSAFRTYKHEPEFKALLKKYQ